MRHGIIFSIKDIATVIKKRQDNDFDSRFAVAGDTGDGKSTLTSKIFYKLGKFKPKKHQCYARDEIIRLLLTEKKGKVFDDEAINSGYKRDWQKSGQQEMIKILTNYRDSLNAYGAALPNFFSLDKDLRDLFFMLLHVIERGMAVVHLPLQGTMYSQDKWDAKNNAKVEQRWNERRKKNPDFRPPYHKLSTFAGYLYFGKMTDAQEKLYKQVKHEKRAKEYEDQIVDKEETFNEKIYKNLIEKKLSTDGLLQICLMNDKKYSSVISQLNTMLKDRGVGKTVGSFLKGAKEQDSITIKESINSLVPTFPRDSL